MSVRVPPRGSTTGSSAWRQCVGSGRCALALRADYQQHLDLVQREIGFGHVRAHGLLHDDMGVVHREVEGPHNELVHRFDHADKVVGAWLDRGARPFIELGFMPSALASGDQTVFWWRGNVTPPREIREWTAAVQATLRHWISRYGLDEVRRWPVEVWNEPNLDVFWRGADQNAYLSLYEATAHAIKEVDADLQVGGPAICGGGEHWLDDWIDFCVRRDVPADFMSRHSYATGPAQHAGALTYQTMAGPEHVLADFASARRTLQDAGLHLPLHITEYNSSYRPDNPVHDTALNAAWVARILSEGGDTADSFSYWTFSDVFEEVGPGAAPFHGGFGLVSLDGIPKPTFHTFAFFARLGEEVLWRDEHCQVRRQADGSIGIVAWNPVLDPDHDECERVIDLALPLPPGSCSVSQWRVRDGEGDPWTAWRSMGRPRNLDRVQQRELEDAARPSHVRSTASSDADGCAVRLTLTRNEVTLLLVAPVHDQSAGYPGLDDTRIPGYLDAR